jgi:glutamyl-tRNA(Gln) amidotransferase subunit E
VREWYDSLPIPELLIGKRSRFIDELHLDPALASQLISSEQVFLFERAVSAGISPSLAARTILATLKELARAGIDTSSISDDDLLRVLDAVEQGLAAKEAIPGILEQVAGGTPVDGAIHECAPAVSREELEIIVRRIVQERNSFITEQGLKSLGPLMGVVMAEVRGSADGKLVSEVLRQEIKRYLAESGGVKR